MTKSIELLRRELHGFCELAQRRGWRIGSTGFFRICADGHPGVCCPMGAINVCIGYDYAFDMLFGGDRNAVRQFAAGFDGKSVGNEDLYGQLGQEFRAHYAGDPQ